MQFLGISAVKYHVDNQVRDQSSFINDNQVMLVSTVL